MAGRWSAPNRKAPWAAAFAAMPPSRGSVRHRLSTRGACTGRSPSSRPLLPRLLVEGAGTLTLLSSGLLGPAPCKGNRHGQAVAPPVSQPNHRQWGLRHMGPGKGCQTACALLARHVGRGWARGTTCHQLGMPAPQRQAPTSGCAALAASASLEAARAGRLLVDPMPFSHLGCALQAYERMCRRPVASHLYCHATDRQVVVKRLARQGQTKSHSPLCTLAKNGTPTLMAFSQCVKAADCPGWGVPSFNADRKPHKNGPFSSPHGVKPVPGLAITGAVPPHLCAQLGKELLIHGSLRCCLAAPEAQCLLWGRVHLPVSGRPC